MRQRKALESFILLLAEFLFSLSSHNRNNGHSTEYSKFALLCNQAKRKKKKAICGGVYAAVNIIP